MFNPNCSIGRKRLQILGDDYHYFGEITCNGMAQGEGMACLVGDRATTISGTWYNDKLNGLGKLKALTDGWFVGIES